MGERRRKFDKDFREGTVRLVRETGKPIAQIASPWSTRARSGTGSMLTGATRIVQGAERRLEPGRPTPVEPADQDIRCLLFWQAGQENGRYICQGGGHLRLGYGDK